MRLKSSTYDILKRICLVILPALTTFYGVLGNTLDIPFTEEVITIAVAFDTMLGTILGISSRNYYKDIDEGESDDAE